MTISKAAPVTYSASAVSDVNLDPQARKAMLQTEYDQFMTEGKYLDAAKTAEKMLRIGLKEAKGLREKALHADACQLSKEGHYSPLYGLSYYFMYRMPDVISEQASEGSNKLNYASCMCQKDYSGAADIAEKMVQNNIKSGKALLEKALRADYDMRMSAYSYSKAAEIAERMVDNGIEEGKDLLEKAMLTEYRHCPWDLEKAKIAANMLAKGISGAREYLEKPLRDAYARTLQDTYTKTQLDPFTNSIFPRTYRYQIVDVMLAYNMQGAQSLLLKALPIDFDLAMKCKDYSTASEISGRMMALGMSGAKERMEQPLRAQYFRSLYVEKHPSIALEKAKKLLDLGAAGAQGLFDIAAEAEGKNLRYWYDIAIQEDDRKGAMQIAEKMHDLNVKGAEILLENSYILEYKQLHNNKRYIEAFELTEKMKSKDLPQARYYNADSMHAVYWHSVEKKEYSNALIFGEMILQLGNCQGNGCNSFYFEKPLRTLYAQYTKDKKYYDAYVIGKKMLEREIVPDLRMVTKPLLNIYSRAMLNKDYRSASKAAELMINAGEDRANKLLLKANSAKSFQDLEMARIITK